MGKKPWKIQKTCGSRERDRKREHKAGDDLRCVFVYKGNDDDGENEVC